MRRRMTDHGRPMRIIFLSLFVPGLLGLALLTATAAGIPPDESKGSAQGPASQGPPLILLYRFGENGWVRTDRIIVAGPSALLIHGLMGSRYDMTALARRLSDPRYGTSYDVFAVQYSLGNDLDSLADRLKSVVTGSAFTESPESSPDLVLVAHSMGGLLARRIIEGEPSTPITRLVTLSSPLNGNQGSLMIADTADALDLPYDRVLPELEDMKTGSAFLAGLNSPTGRSTSCRALFVAGTLPPDSVASGMLKNVLLTPNDGVVEQWSAWGLPAPQAGPVTPDAARAKSILVDRYASCDFRSLNLHHWSMCGHPEVLGLVDEWLGRGR